MPARFSLFALALLLQTVARVACAAPPNATVVEYYRADVDHYFMTASPQEQALLDDGVLKGWTRTGASFLAWTDAAQAPPDAQPVCRFYGRPEAGLDSHFYSAFADECDAVQQKFPLAWQLESPAVFYIQVPDRSSGTCVPGTDAVMRVFDNRTDANHRYVTSMAARTAMQSSGWVAEGYGPDAVVMCAAKAATAADDVALADPVFYASGADASLSGPVDTAAVTHHAITLGATTIGYTATAGHLSARDLQSAIPTASMFYVAYTADGQDAATRPVTFFYNGGPGSATVWLHLGSFGPKRLATGDPSTAGPVPFPMVDNLETLLDTSDLVFVDAVGTGLSEAIAPFTNRSFYSVDKDAALFRDFVRRYVDVNGRTASPKFLFGESYGGARTAVLANLLELAGTSLAGIVLQSPALDYNTNCGIVFMPVLSCATYLPSYASIGAYYQRVDPPPADLGAFRAQVQDFTIDPYAPAVDRYLQSLALPDESVIGALVSSTGIEREQWRSHFNLQPNVFQHRLVFGTVLGRYDARVSAFADSPLATEGDPSSTFIAPWFAQSIQSYLQTTLKYTAPVAYVTSSNALNLWDYAHDGRELPDTIPDLAAALALDPGLRVLTLSGFHDLATPYFQTARDLARLGAGGRVDFRTYEGGHMTYLDDTARPLEKAAVRAFMRSAATAP